MAVTPSSMLPLGTRAPDFTLADTVSGQPVSLADGKGHAATVVMFLCNHCPFVLHVLDGLVDLAREYGDRGVRFIAISSNDVTTHPQDGPDRMAVLARERDFPFPYLYDESQAVARAFQAACTPDFFAFDGDLELAYRGRMDDATPGNNRPVTGADLRAALDAVLVGKPVDADQTPSMGCNIKWKAEG